MNDGVFEIVEKGRGGDGGIRWAEACNYYFGYWYLEVHLICKSYFILSRLE